MPGTYVAGPGHVAPPAPVSPSQPGHGSAVPPPDPYATGPAGRWPTGQRPTAVPQRRRGAAAAAVALGVAIVVGAVAAGAYLLTRDETSSTGGSAEGATTAAPSDVNTLTWNRVTLPEGRFSLEMPGTPKPKVESDTLDGETVTFSLLFSGEGTFDEATTGMFALEMGYPGNERLPDMPLSEYRQPLEDAAELMAGSVLDGVQYTSTEVIDSPFGPTLRFSGTDNGQPMAGYLVLAPDRFLMIMVATDPGGEVIANESAARAFRSLQRS